MSFPEAFYRWRPHPWHGLEVGSGAPDIVNAYIEITPFDLMKYEVDKVTGYLCVDRPQRGSSYPPALYGFIPRTYCGPRVAKLCTAAKSGDGDPMDVCVMSERPINRSEVILRVRVVGGIKMIDDGEADDKIVAVLQNDLVWGNARDIGDLPPALIERLQHYFSTYKLIPGQQSRVSIEPVYDREHALEVVRASMKDYEEEFGD